MSDVADPRYPIGRFARLSSPGDVQSRAALMEDIIQLPAELRALTHAITDAELSLSYREGGWTIRQVIHHVPDSHMHAYLRMKFAITEEKPLIKAYDEKAWAQLPDGESGPIDYSLDLLDALHRRWVYFLRSLSDADFARTFVHPVLGGMSIEEALAMYAWHGCHHAAHVRNALATASRG